MEIRSVSILTNDPDKIRLFYGSQLGFTIQDQTPEMVSFKAGASALTFINDQAPAFYHFAFGIPFDRFSAAFNWTEQRAEILTVEGGGKIADFKSWNAQSFYFHDPVGNIVEFIARYDWRGTTETDFTVAEIFNINEIGLVSSDIRGIGNELERSGFSYYFRGPKLDDFMPMGDDNGLLLLCATGKSWMPTGRPAEQFWTKVSVCENGKDYELTIQEK